MKMYIAKCPACGASVEAEKGRETVFCSYCGTKIHIDDEVRRIEVTKNVNYRKTYTDEAKLRKIESEERMHERELAEKRGGKRHFAALGICVTVCFVALLLVTFGVGLVNESASNATKKASDAQEQELQMIADEAMQNIADGRFAEAYINAEKIRYTESGSYLIRDKWDTVREEIIKQIEKAENGTASDESGETVIGIENAEIIENVESAESNDGGGAWWNPFD